MILNSGYMDDFVNDIDDQDKISIQQKRSSIWALTFIGSTEYGIRILKDQGIIEKIIRIAEESPYLALRGTCINSMAMLSKTKKGE